MPKLKHSEWDPLSGGVFRVTVSDKSYLALSRKKASEWMMSPSLIKLAKEKEGYLFFKEPLVSSVALFASEEFANAANPALNPFEISRLRVESRKCAEEKYSNLGKFLEPPAPDHVDFPETSPAP